MTNIPSTSLVSLRLFGGIHVLVEGQPLPPLHSKRSLWLLALLALNVNQPMERSRIAGMFWPDSPEATALHNLRQVLTDLRKAMGNSAACLVADKPRTLRLDCTHVSVDLHAFDKSCANTNRQAMERTAELYCGPLLDGCDEPWVVPARQAREALYLELLQRLASESSASGDWAASTRWLRLAIAADPYNETAHRSLMKSLAASAEAPAALEVYQALRRRLSRDLNSEPDAATASVYREIRSNGSPLLLARSQSQPVEDRTIPVPPNRLIGRDHEVEHVLRLLSQSRLVTITGPGGIGKTRLAIEVANRYEVEIGGRVVFVGLAAVVDAEAIPDAVLAALGLATSDAGVEPLIALRRYLSTRCIFIVLDNCEHLIDACATFADELVAHCEDLRILATSRHATGLSVETLYRTPSLSLPANSHNLDMDNLESTRRMESFAAIALFAERARSVDSAFRISRTNFPVAVDICRRLEGIPLAIELAASRVRSLSLEDIDLKLSHGLGVLTRGATGPRSRHKTLELTFEWSWGLLSSSERVMLARLSAFLCGFTLEAAESVCSGGDVACDHVMDLLTSLVDKSMVIFVGRDIEGDTADQPKLAARYTLLEPIRQFASARLIEVGEDQEIRNRHCNFYVNWAESIRPKLFAAGHQHWFKVLDADHNNLRIALRWCSIQPELADLELRLVVAIARFWDTNGHVREGRENLEAAVMRMSPTAPANLQAEALIHAGWAAGLQEDAQACRSHYRRAISVLGESGNTLRRANVLNLLGSVERAAGEVNTAKELLEESLSIYRSTGSGQTNSSLLNNLSSIELELGNIEASRAYLEQSVCACENKNAPQQLAITLRLLAVVNLEQGRVAEAEFNCLTSLRLLRECGAITDIPYAVGILSQISARLNDWARSALLLGATIGLHEEMAVKLNLNRHQEICSQVEDALGPETFAVALAEGRRMNWQQVVVYALKEGSS